MSRWRTVPFACTRNWGECFVRYPGWYPVLYQRENEEKTREGSLLCEAVDLEIAGFIIQNRRYMMRMGNTFRTDRTFCSPQPWSEQRFGRRSGDANRGPSFDRNRECVVESQTNRSLRMEHNDSQSELYRNVSPFALDRGNSKYFGEATSGYEGLVPSAS
ncbi:uncharacterized protein BT62DRAFT_923450 [Guyanagaster necrorhizus]|uniref:Uncharacterized protein n=1 Tax=Guyanagaster necrorhizus TaxID=856835 RepID=A0A9P7VHN1_9AGAR|nr:uncharacterized protein BT62DRAFT_923450 [Guyanagaster necrorhizus MCA 3950]KAG7441226.1 hypothetical protein BT62DRAFT_923450 [Guyanagaster necrorhizus MCA 3950]